MTTTFGIQGSIVAVFYVTPMDAAERASIEAGLLALGVTPNDFNAVRVEPSFEGATAALERVKEKVRKAYKKLAFELHPDRTGNDPAKTELFKAVSKIRAEIDALTIERGPLPVPVPVGIPVIIIQYGYGGVGRPPPGHPAANGGVRQWGAGAGSATTTVTTWPTGVQVPRGPRR